MSLAAKLPYDHPYAGGFSGIGSQPLPTDSDCLTYLAAVKSADGAGVEVSVATAVDAFFRGTKAAGVFDALKACCILAGARTLAGALVPVVGDAPTNVADGFVEGDYSRTDGLTGDGSTTYLDSGRANDDDPQDDAHLSVYLTSPVTSGGVYGLIGTAQSSPLASHVVGVNSVDDVFFRSNTLVSLDIESLGQSTGLYGVTRNSASLFSVRVQGSSSSLAQTSLTPASLNYHVFARNISGTGGSLADATIAFYSIGTAVDLEDLDTAVTNLINAIGNAL